MGIVNVAIIFLCHCLYKITTVFLSHCLAEVHRVPLHLSQERHRIAHLFLKL